MADSKTKATFKKCKKKDVQTIKALFLEHYANAKTELVYHNLYELLVCVMLSAQCTDKRVNLVTPALFAAFPNVESLAKADIEEIKALIKSVSFFNNKAKHLKAMANQVMNEFNGAIPTTQTECGAKDSQCRANRIFRTKLYGGRYARIPCVSSLGLKRGKKCKANRRRTHTFVSNTPCYASSSICAVWAIYVQSIKTDV